MQNTLSNFQDFLTLQNKYFHGAYSNLVDKISASNERKNIFTILSKKKNKKVEKSIYAVQRTINKFARIPITFLSTFDQEHYLYANEDVRNEIKAGKFDNALEHFIFFGYDEVKEGRRRLGNELPFMSEEQYIEFYPDIKQAMENGAIVSGFDHFLSSGYQEIEEGTRPLLCNYPFLLNEDFIQELKKSFDEERYLAANGDVKEAIEKSLYKNGWEHFIQNGLEEVRRGERIYMSGLPFMSESEYIFTSRDIFDALKSGMMKSAFRHFLLVGAKEIIDGTRSISKEAIYRYVAPILSDEIKAEMETFEQKPLISVIMPVYNVDAKWLELAVASLEAQWYKNWELCIADDKSTKEETTEYLKSIVNPKIKVTFLDENVNISGASNEALKIATGEYIALMDNDDELTTDALYEVVKSINENGAEFIYSDEDKLELDGSYSQPHFKPDYAPDMLLSQNYISHIGVIKKSLIDQVGGWALGLEGAQDYDLYLKVLEHTNKVAHIPKVLYHWRKIPGSTAAEFSDKSYAQEAGVVALQNAMQRRNILAHVHNGKYPGTYRVQYNIINEPLVSIVIPFKDKPELLDMCINSILDKSTYQNYEIIGMSNNSEEAETFEMMETLKAKDKRITFYEYNEPFNYSAINNYAVKEYAKGEHVILLNNDIEIISPDWIEALLEFSQQEDVGAVGAKLYYPDDTIQHAGVIIGLGGVAGHSHKYFTNESPGYFYRLNIAQNLSAVTAACLMLKKSIYDEVEGLNEENLKIAFNDVDFCLRIQESGYKNIFTPYCEAYHHESISRGAEDNPEKVARFVTEIEYVQERHKDILKDGDPYYNVNLTLAHEDFNIKG